MNAIKKNIEGICVSDDALLLETFVRDRYLPFIREHKKSWRTDERYLTRHILPHLGRCPLTEISEETLQHWLRTLEMSGLSTSSCRRFFWLVKYMLNCAVRWGLLENDASFRRMIFPRAEKRSPEALSVEEMRQIMNILDEYADRPSAQAIRLILLTGAGKSEILSARWEDVHLKNAVLVANSAFTGRRRIIPLNPEAVGLLRTLPRREQVPWLFSSASGERISSLFYTWNLIRRRLGRPGLRLQDLRHGFAGFLMSAGLGRGRLKSLQEDLGVRSSASFQEQPTDTEYAPCLK